MWVSHSLMALLLLMATTEGFHSELYPLAERLLAPNEIAPIPMREARSGIFWTGSRYSRRGSSDIKKQVKQRADRFYIGSRYGKRSERRKNGVFRQKLSRWWEEKPENKLKKRFSGRKIEEST